jgi:hypothetical protein
LQVSRAVAPEFLQSLNPGKPLVDSVSHRFVQCLVFYLGSDTGMGNTVTIWSRVCSGTGTGLGWSYLSNTVPVLTGLWVLYTCQYISFATNNLLNCEVSVPGHNRTLKRRSQVTPLLSPNPPLQPRQPPSSLQTRVRGGLFLYSVLPLISIARLRGTVSFFIILKSNIDNFY